MSKESCATNATVKKTAFKAKIIVEYKTDKYLVSGISEPSFEQLGVMIKNGDVAKVEWVFDWLQNGNEPVLIITEKDE